MLDLVREEKPLSFATAEVVAMSWATLLTADFEQARSGATDYQNVTNALDRVYGALRDEAAYRPATFHATLATLASLLEKN